MTTKQDQLNAREIKMLNDANKNMLVMGGMLLGLSLYNIVLRYWLEAIVGTLFGFGFIFLHWQGESK